VVNQVSVILLLPLLAVLNGRVAPIISFVSQTGIIKPSKILDRQRFHLHLNGGLNQILRRQTSRSHYGSKVPAVRNGYQQHLYDGSILKEKSNYIEKGQN
jgi:hypothetical protein